MLGQQFCSTATALSTNWSRIRRAACPRALSDQKTSSSYLGRPAPLEDSRTYHGVPLVSVTNQPGAAKGITSVEAIQATHARVLELLAAEGSA